MNRFVTVVKILNNVTNRLMGTNVMIVRILARVVEPFILLAWINGFVRVVLQIPGYHQWEGALIAITIVGIALFPFWMAEWVMRAREQDTTPPQPAIYEIGSPEYNAQVVGAILTLNEQLASQGKRIPERTAMEIIHLIEERSEQ